MKRFLPGSLMRKKKEETEAHPSEAAYEDAMRVYKIFAYVSGAAVTVAYIVSLMF